MKTILERIERLEDDVAAGHWLLFHGGLAPCHEFLRSDIARRLVQCRIELRTARMALAIAAGCDIATTKVVD